MALWEFSNLNKHGNYRKRIIHTEGALSIPGDGFGPSVFANRYQYEYKHPHIPPTLATIQGKTYLMPLWQEVVEGTTLNDIKWNRPKPKTYVKPEPVVETHMSGSGLGEYKTKFYPESGKFHCSCPGYWRSSGNCKHVKAMRTKLGDTK